MQEAARLWGHDHCPQCWEVGLGTPPQEAPAVSSHSEDAVPCGLAVPFLYKHVARCSTRKVLFSTVTNGKKDEGGDLNYPQREE